jgi:hypothetical protein
VGVGLGEDVCVVFVSGSACVSMCWCHQGYSSRCSFFGTFRVGSRNKKLKRGTYAEEGRAVQAVGVVAEITLEGRRREQERGLHFNIRKEGGKCKFDV